MDAIDQKISELARGSLPKWPQMLVTGKDVTPEQAFEIIFKTDGFLTDASEFAGGNEREFTKQYQQDSNLTALHVTRKYPEGHEYADVDWSKQNVLRNHLGVLSTNYVSNDWASSCFIFGPHGWCSPTGKIYFVDNVGKWPSIREVYDDWVLIAQAFPFVEANVTLMSGESTEDESSPVINFKVANGAVEVCAPDESVHNAVPRSVEDIGYYRRNGELGLPSHWYKQAAARVAAAIEFLNATGAFEEEDNE